MAKFNLNPRNPFVSIIKDLANGLRKLTFLQNFDSFEIEETIAANTEITIRNRLTTVPSYVIIVKQTGNAIVTAGDTEWTTDYVYMKNHDLTNSAVVKMIFFR